MSVPGGEGLWRERNAPAEESEPKVWVVVERIAGERQNVYGPFDSEVKADKFAADADNHWHRATQGFAVELLQAER